ncbi:MAG: slr1659 superfamily regulator [Bacteroidales bacterium]
MELEVGDSKLTYDRNQHKVVIEGSMRLANLTEYEVVSDFLNKVSEQANDGLTIDLRNLEFLNSSGITTFSMFILSCKKQGKPKLKVLGSNDISWQEKSLRNFKKLWEDVDVLVN